MAQAAAREGVAFLLAGRSRERVEWVASTLEPRPEVLVANVRVPASLAVMAAQASVVIDCAGPFAQLGRPVLDACMVEGAHFVDTSGEQQWVVEVADLDAQLGESGIVGCPALGFEVAIAECAVELVVEKLEKVRRVCVVYAFEGIPSTPSSRSSLVLALSRPGWQHLGGSRTLTTLAAERRVMSHPELGHRSVVSFPGAEAITLPFHLDTPEVRTFMMTPPGAAPVLQKLGPLFPLLARSPLGALASRLGVRSGEDSHLGATVYVTAHGEADDEPHAWTAVVNVPDIYQAGAQTLLEGALALVRSPPRVGFRSPAEVLGSARALFDRLRETCGVEVTVRAGDLGI